MIGVYDSGYGGLTVLRALRAALPTHDFVYLGDSGRAPYGGRDTDTILDFAEQCVERLFEEGCPLVVVACHTVSCVALRHLQRRYGPGGALVGAATESDSAGATPRRILGVTIPAAEAAVAQSRGHIGVIGTARTVSSGTFATELAKLGPHRVTQRAAPLLAPIVEEGWEDSAIARLAVARYVAELGDIDTLVLGCTHYPLLRAAFEATLPEGVAILDPAPFVAARLSDWLDRHPGFVAPGTGTLRVLCTDPAGFRAHGERFLGEPLPVVAHVAEEGGRLAHKATVEVRLGQIVR
ncbi:MAG: aspartate/glutamate racemase family protein [Pseudomonadota bacterium]|nr:aspartate/glutamate racemase family protein [Pseudomonadota bacterium]